MRAKVIAEWVLSVDSDEEAEELARSFDKSIVLNMFAAAEREGTSVLELHKAGFKYLGVRVETDDSH